MTPAPPREASFEEARDALHQTWCPAPLCNGYPTAHREIAELEAAHARELAAARAEQAEIDMWLAHSDAGCEGQPLSEYECGRIAAFNDICKERDKQRAAAAEENGTSSARQERPREGVEMVSDPKPPTVEEMVREAHKEVIGVCVCDSGCGCCANAGDAIDALAARVRELEGALSAAKGEASFHFDRTVFFERERDEARGERDDFKTTMLAIRKQRDDYAAKVLAFDAGAENLVAENARLRERMAALHAENTDVVMGRDRLRESIKEHHGYMLCTAASCPLESCAALREGREGKG